MNVCVRVLYSSRGDCQKGLLFWLFGHWRKKKNKYYRARHFQPDTKMKKKHPAQTGIDKNCSLRFCCCCCCYIFFSAARRDMAKYVCPWQRLLVLVAYQQLGYSAHANLMRICFYFVWYVCMYMYVCALFSRYMRCYIIRTRHSSVGVFFLCFCAFVVGTHEVFVVIVAFLLLLLFVVSVFSNKFMISAFFSPFLFYFICCFIFIFCKRPYVYIVLCSIFSTQTDDRKLLCRSFFLCLQNVNCIYMNCIRLILNLHEPRFV